MTSAGIYAQLLPAWEKFCVGRRENYTALDSIEAYAALRLWEEEVAIICGVDTQLEWPEDNQPVVPEFLRLVPIGCCIVAGCIIFNDTLPRLTWE